MTTWSVYDENEVAIAGPFSSPQEAWGEADEIVRDGFRGELDVDVTREDV